MHVWDTLGQEKFKSIAPIFFRKSAAALLVYDVTDKDSFLALPTWKEQIKNNSQENIVVILVGNKVDLPNKVITNEMGSNFAKENGWLFMEVSAKADINIKSAFLSLTSSVYTAITGEVSKPGQDNFSDNRGESISLHKKTSDSEVKKKKDCKC